MHTTLQHPNRLVVTALGLGLCADYLFYGRWLGISVPVFVALALAILLVLSRAEERPPVAANAWLGAAALVFAVFVALRDAPFLAALDLLAALGLLALFAAHYRAGPLSKSGGAAALLRALLAPAEISLRPAPLAIERLGTVQIDGAQARRLAPVGRGLALATPALAIFTGLLMAADSVFASYVSQLATLRLPFDPNVLLAHTAIAGSVAWLYAGGALTALHSGSGSIPLPANPSLQLFGGGWGAPPAEPLPAEGDTRPLPALRKSLLAIGAIEGLTVLLAVDALFGGFMLIQAAYFFGGLDTLDRTGMTYASYARRGFFELVTVAFLTLLMLVGLALLTRREHTWQRRSFNAASTAMIVLVLGLLASAFQRMWLYEQAYGYTRLRLYTHSFMLWLAVVLGLLLLALLRDKPRLFAFGGFVAALLYLAVLNVANPDALIVRENVARYAASGKLDTEYLTQLSADATPALVAALPALDSKTRARIADELAWQYDALTNTAAGQGWPAWSLPRARARWAIAGMR